MADIEDDIWGYTYVTINHDIIQEKKSNESVPIPSDWIMMYTYRERIKPDNALPVKTNKDLSSDIRNIINDFDALSREQIKDNLSDLIKTPVNNKLRIHFEFNNQYSINQFKYFFNEFKAKEKFNKFRPHMEIIPYLQECMDKNEFPETYEIRRG